MHPRCNLCYSHTNTCTMLSAHTHTVGTTSKYGNESVCLFVWVGVCVCGFGCEEKSTNKNTTRENECRTDTLARIRFGFVWQSKGFIFNSDEMLLILSVRLSLVGVLVFVQFCATHMDARVAYHTSIKFLFTYALWIIQLNLALDK